MKTIIKKTGLALAAVGLVGAAAMVPEAMAAVCKTDSSAWGASANHSCTEPAISVTTTSTSTSATQNGVKVLVADLTSLTGTLPQNYFATSWAVGLDSTGGELNGFLGGPSGGAECHTGGDESTAPGTSVYDNDGGCETAVKHRLYTRINLF